MEDIVLPTGCKIFQCYIDNETFSTHGVYYINTDRVALYEGDDIFPEDCFLDVEHCSVGSVTYYFDEKRRELKIEFLRVSADYRERKYATLLMKILLDTYKDRVDVFSLEDVSSRVWKDKNIYKQLGFEYTHEYPKQTMELKC